MNALQGPAWLDALCLVMGIVIIIVAFDRYGGPRGPKKRLFWLTVAMGLVNVFLGLVGWF